MLTWSNAVAYVVSMVSTAVVVRQVQFWFRRRRYRVDPPLKGSRPHVTMEHDGILYDLSEDLEQIENDSSGSAQWVIHGPLHLRMDQPPALWVRRPVPRDTHIQLFLVGQPPQVRFADPEECGQLRAGQSTATVELPLE